VDEAHVGTATGVTVSKGRGSRPGFYRIPG